MNDLYAGEDLNSTVLYTTSMNVVLGYRFVYNRYKKFDF